MSRKLVSTTALVVRMLCVFSLVILILPTTLSAQLPWTEDFSDNNGQGIRGGCPDNTPSNCATYSAPTDWSISGNLTGLANNNDFFQITGGDELRARDVDNQICYTSNTVIVASPTNFNLEVDLRESGYDNSSDYIQVYRWVDGIQTFVNEANNSFSSTTISETNIPVNSTIQIQVCFYNNAGNDSGFLSEIRLTEACATTPTAVCQDITVAIVGGSATITTGDVDNGSTYPCGLQSMSLSQTNFDCNDIGNNTVTLTVTDNNSNTDQCTANVTVTNSGGSPPSFDSCPSDITLNNDTGNCTAVYNYTTPTAADVTVNDFDENYGECFWTITEEDGSDVDFSGAPSSVLFTSANNGNSFQFTDIIKTMDCDATITFDWDYSVDSYGFAYYDPGYFYLNGWAYWLTAPSAGDQRGSVTINVSAGDDFGIGIYTYDGIDGPAVFDVTNFQVVETTTVTMTSGLASGAAFPVGTTTVEYTASSCGGTETCSFDVTVNDNESPIISCPSNITGRGTDSGQCYATINGIAPTVNENCPTVNYTLTGATTGSGSDDASGTQFNPGTTTVTYTVTDPASNTDNCSFTIEVVNGLDVRDYNAFLCDADAGAVDLRIYEDSITTETGTVIWYFDAAKTNPVGVSPPVVDVSDGRSMFFEFQETSSGCTADGILDFTLDPCTPTLPVELIYFIGEEQDCEVLIQWATQTEENASHFEVQRSADGIDFEKVAELSAVGNSTSTEYYNYLDKNVNTRDNYYRLKQIDLDGTFEYTEIILIKVNCFDQSVQDVNLYPNPVFYQDEINVTFKSIIESQEVEVKIYDARGTVVLLQSINVSEGYNAATLNIGDLPAANYFLNIRNVQYKGITKAFIIVRD